MNRPSIIGRGYHSEEHPLGFYTRGDHIKTRGGIDAFFWVPGHGPLAVAWKALRWQVASAPWSPH
ncbi:MAG: hypothetical protein ACYCZJ_05560 [Sulfuriferula sp.]